MVSCSQLWSLPKHICLLHSSHVPLHPDAGWFLGLLPLPLPKCAAHTLLSGLHVAPTPLKLHTNRPCC